MSLVALWATKDSHSAMERWRNSRRRQHGVVATRQLDALGDTGGAPSRRPQAWDVSIACIEACTSSGTDAFPGTGAAWRRCSHHHPPSPAISRPPGSGDSSATGRGRSTSPARARVARSGASSSTLADLAGRGSDGSRRDSGHLALADHPRPRGRSNRPRTIRRQIQRGGRPQGLRPPRDARPARPHATGTGAGRRSGPRWRSTTRRRSSPAPASSGGSMRSCSAAGLPAPAMNYFVAGYEIDAWWEAGAVRGRTRRLRDARVAAVVRGRPGTGRRAAARGDRDHPGDRAAARSRAGGGRRVGPPTPGAARFLDPGIT